MKPDNATVGVDVLHDFTVGHTCEDLSLSFASGLPGDSHFDEVVQAIAAKIDSGKKPSKSLCAQLAKIELYRGHLSNALTELFAIYTAMTTHQTRTRTSPALKARQCMLRSMSDKVLKMYASDYMDVDEYILPDDREVLITALCGVLARADAPAEESVTAV